MDPWISPLQRLRGRQSAFGTRTLCRNRTPVAEERINHDSGLCPACAESSAAGAVGSNRAAPTRKLASPGRSGATPPVDLAAFAMTTAIEGSTTAPMMQTIWIGPVVKTAAKISATRTHIAIVY